MRIKIFNIAKYILIVVVSFILGFQFSLSKYGIKDNQIIGSIINIIKNNYLEDVKDKDFAKVLVNGLNDPYSIYFNQNEYQSFETQISNNYVGIGVIISKTDNKVRIIKVFKNSPAEKAKIELNTEIIRVNDVSVEDLDVESISSLIKGPINSELKLTIKFKDKTEEINLKREKIIIETVEGQMITPDLAYIRIITFNFGTDDEFNKILDSLLKEKPKGLILDLRDNGGGVLEVTTNIAKRFLNNNSVLFYTVGRDKKENPTYVKGSNPINLPLLVAVNGYSASASEVLAGAIVDNKIGKLVGEKTYGKGTIQRIFNIPINNGAVKLTVQKYLTPEKHDLNKNGLVPEYIFSDKTANVDPTKDPLIKYSIDLLNK